MSTLNSDQFAGKVNLGGASRLLLSHTEVAAGPEHRDTYAVGMPGHEEKIDHPVVRQQVHEHEQRMLADPTLSTDPQVLQGGWKQDSSVFLDASRQVKGRKEAVNLGRQNHQIAVYDLGHDRDIYMRRPTVDPNQRVRGSRRTGYRVKNRQS